ncbi:MAG: tetratricopeptide repeat protein [Kiritimatiellales bacterium]
MIEAELLERIHRQSRSGDLLRLAVLYARQKRPEEGLSVLQQLLERPNCPREAHLLHGDLLRGMKRSEEAAGAYAAAVRADPMDPEALFRMGLALRECGEINGAFQAFQQVLQRNRWHVPAALCGVQMLLHEKRFADAVRWLEMSEDLKEFPELTGAYAQALLDSGDCERCVDFLRAHPMRLRQHSMLDALLIRAMVYDPRVTAESIFSAVSAWHDHHKVEKPLNAGISDPDPARRLRLGFVGTRFCLHNSSTHLLALLKHADPGQFEIFLYSDSARQDEMTEALRKVSNHWKNIHTLTEEQAAIAIRDDRIDILVDLHEFSNESRLRIFGFKPAPVQVHWYGNAVTTGLKAMDWRISSRRIDPPENDPFSAERILDVSCYYLYEPSPMARSTEWITVPPSVKNGFVTFGAIHHFAKYNRNVLKTWREIMERVPNSRLLLGREQLRTESSKKALLDRFVEEGLDAGRIDLEGDPATVSSLEIFNRIDIALDSFPFNGDATTSDTLWMGVPLITLEGARTASRRAAEQLRLCGHPEWIACSPDEYIEKAVELAQSPETLAAARKTLHAEFAVSPMCDHPRTAAGIYAALRRAWRAACLVSTV